MRKMCIFGNIITGVLFLGLILFNPVYAVHDTNEFELDGDPLKLQFSDWDNMGTPIATTGILTDHVPENTIFTTGGSKDNNPIADWKWKKASNILDKDDILNAFASAYNVGGHLVIYFGLDRYASKGTSQVGFWFLRDHISLTGDGKGSGDGFVGEHRTGDILIQSNFTDGGDVSGISVYEWIDGNLVLLSINDDPVDTDCTTVPDGDYVCATVNKDIVTNVPWDYTPKDGDAGTFPIATFFEGGVDLTALGLTDTCFSSFMAESRASEPFDSTLKDFVLPVPFNTCTVSVTKNCSNPVLSADETSIVYDITGTVTAEGFGASLYNIELFDTPVADGPFTAIDFDDNSVIGTFPLDSLSTTVKYTGKMTVPLTSNGISDIVTVKANTKPDGSGTELLASATADCPKLTISPMLKVTKMCKTELDIVGDKVVVKVNVSGEVENTGDTTISNVTVDDNDLVTTPDPLLNNVTLAPGEKKEYSGSYYPSVSNDGTDNPTTSPGSVVWKDTVTATAFDIFGKPVTPDTAPAMCTLCQ